MCITWGLQLTLSVPLDLLTSLGSKRSALLLLRLAGARPPRALRCVRNPDLVDPRNRNPHDVRRTNGMRGPQFCPEAYIEGRETETNAWEGIRDAIVSCPIRGILLPELDAVLALSTRTQEAHTVPYTIEYACKSWVVRTGIGKCGFGFVE